MQALSSCLKSDLHLPTWARMTLAKAADTVLPTQISTCQDEKEKLLKIQAPVTMKQSHCGCSWQV